jgi:hypothetical protein
MYFEYLTKVALKKQNSTHIQSQDVDMDLQTDEQRKETLKDYEMEESKESQAKSMKTGEKYIIRKLIAFKITISKIDEYIQKVEAIVIKDITPPANTSNTQFSPFGMSNMFGNINTNQNSVMSEGNQYLNNFQNPMFK